MSSPRFLPPPPHGEGTQAVLSLLVCVVLVAAGCASAQGVPSPTPAPPSSPSVPSTAPPEAQPPQVPSSEEEDDGQEPSQEQSQGQGQGQQSSSQSGAPEEQAESASDEASGSSSNSSSPEDASSQAVHERDGHPDAPHHEHRRSRVTELGRQVEIALPHSVAIGVGAALEILAVLPHRHAD